MVKEETDDDGSGEGEREKGREKRNLRRIIEEKERKKVTEGGN